ncbi:MAG: VF530 family protein [Pseudomonadales bacterium]|nr:VF530 family protein [Pseudomonadales bacterium]
MTDKQPNNPLHGITLEQLLTQLVDHYGWEYLGQRININCFKSDPSIKSSLKFLRKTLWAREKVENLYISMLSQPKRNQHNEPVIDPWKKARTIVSD